MRRNSTSFATGLFAGLVVILLAFVFEYLEKQRFQEALHAHAISQLSQVRANLEAGINANFYLTRGLIAFVATHPNLEQDTFHRISKNLLHHRNSIRNIGLAPDNILSFVHPIKGNEKAIGLDYAANKKQWPAVKKAIDSHKTVVAGPVNLVQGGSAFISRTPIYIDSDDLDYDERYWGLASIVIDKEKLFQEAGFYNTNLDIVVAIRGVDGRGEHGGFIDGEQKVFKKDPVVLDVHLPEGRWQLAAVPHDGWGKLSPYLKWIRSGGVILSLLTGFGISTWLHRMNQTQHKIKEAWKKAKQATKTLQENKNFLNAIVENIPNMIFVKDAKDLRFLRFNKAGEELTGYSREELIGKNDYDLFSKENADLLTEKDREILANGKSFNIPKELIQTQHKGNRILHTRKIPILDAHNSPEYLLGISEDITERIHAEEEKKALEKKLNQSQRLESIGLMAGGVAHDLNNILSGVVCYPELILLDLPEDSNLREKIEAIQESGQRAATIVADLLTVARGAASTRVVHNLNSLIEEYMKSPEFKSLKSLYPNITYQHQLKATHPSILCSSVHVKKCLMNLVTNATEAILDGGNVVVSTHHQDIDDDTSTEQNIKAGEYVVLSVQDTGPGIPNKDLEHIFEPFYTKKVMGRSGTGLGLTVVWNTMEDHKGKILVQSTDIGTCFLLYFPVNKQKRFTQVKNDKTAELIGNGEHILVVDDEPQLRDIASQMLQSFGYVVDSVSSGELAIEFIKETPVDLIVVDMLMEPGINGRQTYEEILKLYPDQKAIIASGFSESADVKATLKLGANGFIKKPYSIDRLGGAVKKALNS